MKILIATGIYPPDIGGPAQYTKGVEEAWRAQGHTVQVLSFGIERKLPTGIRHLYYFFRVLFSLPRADFVFSPDTFSAAIPAFFASKLFGKKIIIRTGGDFLWEWYVERTGDLALLRNFYQTRIPRFNLKERIIFCLVRFLFRHAGAVIFSTLWQRDIFRQPYTLNLEKCFVVENYYTPPTRQNYSDILKNNRIEKVFVGGTRELKWKNIPRVKDAFLRLQQKGVPVSLKLETSSREQFLKDMASSYTVILASLGDISPNTILEAIQYGKPFILTRETGLYEKLKNISVWVDPEDVYDIAEKIEWLADEKNYEEQRKKVEAFTFAHSWEKIADEIFDILKGRN